MSFRLPSDELDLLQTAAQERGESLSQFIRDSIQARLRGSDSRSWRTSPLLRALSTCTPGRAALDRRSRQAGSRTTHLSRRTSRGARVCRLTIGSRGYRWKSDQLVPEQPASPDHYCDDGEGDPRDRSASSTCPLAQRR
ncbi:MAG: ribbon-helix-helix protein, CopG family [Acidimicrobiales bacterium]